MADSPYLWIFVVTSLALTWLCRRQLRNPKCHGFYRFFAFELLLVLAVVNIHPTEMDFFSPLGTIAGGFTLASLMVAFLGYKALQKAGVTDRHQPENFPFENTQQVVTWGIYAYIRHPMYASLILLGIGLLLHGITPLTGGLLTGVCVFVWLAAKTEEQESLAFFGQPYAEYQRQSKMLVPQVI
ncbi:hypothetical protein KO507_17285 [Gilvimarinus agarilyticus]|uniref:methyltransferase family protein n=1 Tax=unclassified Gilvimarinus TaxID=2642066 RepID=UPI001C09DE06|nr:MULTISPECIES: methyltransferase [unclassified Gilvimarinus]MBU2887522.1 hypothetical protein [Gilvimarinus agarilyticus]MDO6572173.1 methyltransferase [Gilvimarinus sp. 2_MG-2023]MDO6746737.1 methyltransferase [Gilvimarinus sp. 1_MG-2023]